ncbi:hypothetical protein ACHQM5_022728 [Ranunculus cassubicifolius]
MDTSLQITQTKLTRTNSSLLRSSPTIRSSIHSISSIYEEDDEEAAASEEEKPHTSSSSSSSKGVSSRFVGVNRFLLPGVVIFIVTPWFFFYLYLGRDSGNFGLLAVIFIGIAVYVVKKKSSFIIKNSSFLKQLWDERNRRVGFSKIGSNGESVQWFIGSNGERGSSSSFKEKIIKEGVEFYSNGDFYEGEFHKGRSNGSGVYNYFVNGRYEGDWIDGRYDGYGIESWARGSRYRGQYRHGLRHGFGVYRFYTGDSYAGEWCNGQSHGVGVQTCSDGSSYVGEFKCGVKHGLGCYHFRNGDRYAGEYFGDKVHGFGVYHFANGHCYEGSWHEGRKQGFGNYSFRNGETRFGEWDNGVLKNPQSQLNDTISRAIQSARKASENAIQIPRVDEQVNKAVRAANRAATAARVAAVKAVQNRMDGRFCDIDV